MKKILILLLALHSGVAISSEDNDKHPECPYVLDDGEDCVEKTLRMYSIDKSLEAQEKAVRLKDIRNVPEPGVLGLVVLGVLFLVYIRSIKV